MQPSSPTTPDALLLASLHDVPTPSAGGVYVSDETGELVASEEDYAACWGWFRKRLLREPLGPEIFKVARMQYHAGAYESAAVMLLLFRGAHSEIRVRGGGTEDLEVSHLWAHLLWKMGRNGEALEALTHILQNAPRGTHEECWQLLVELGLEREMEEHTYEKSGATALASGRPEKEDYGKIRDGKLEDGDEITSKGGSGERHK